eukprot:2497507-Karenia_brevis.AAC.1
MYGPAHTKKRGVKVSHKTKALYKDNPGSLVRKVRRYTKKVGQKICKRLDEGGSDAWVSDTTMTLSSASSSSQASGD